MFSKNKDMVHRLFEEVWNKGDRALVDELFAPGYIHHDPSTPDFGYGPESEKQRVALYRAAFPDLHVSIDDLIAEKDQVVVRWAARGTHRGELKGVAPTGREITVTGISVVRISHGKFVQGWASWDAQGLTEQLRVRAAAAGA